MPTESAFTLQVVNKATSPSIGRRKNNVMSHVTNGQSRMTISAWVSHLALRLCIYSIHASYLSVFLLSHTLLSSEFLFAHDLFGFVFKAAILILEYISSVIHCSVS